MALETANYIPELVPSNPAGTDPKSQGDDHIRLTKLALTQSFPGFVGTTATPKSVSLTEDQINDAALKSEAQTISGNWTIANNVYMYGRNVADDSSFQLIGVDASDIAIVGDPTNNGQLVALSSFSAVVGGNPAGRFTARESGGVIVADWSGNERKAGYRNPGERVTSTAVDQPSQADEGQIVLVKNPTTSVDLVALEARTTFTLIVEDASVALTSSAVVIKYFDGRGNPAPTGSRTIAQSSVVQVQYIDAANVRVWGNGIT